MNGDEFVDAVERHISPVLEPMGFHLRVSTSGRLYSAEYQSPKYVVSISFEPGDEYFLVIVFTIKNGVRSNIDDRATSPRLADLNARFLTAKDGTSLSKARGSLNTSDPVECSIQKAAAELAVVLPRYIECTASAP